MLLGAPAPTHGARTRHDDRSRRDFERLVALGSIHGLAYEIIHWRAARQNNAGTEYRPRPHHCALIDTAIAADQHVVFNDDRGGVDRFEHATDLRRRAEMDARADLSTGTDEGMRVDHRAGSDVGADVDIHRRHADNAR